MLTKCEEATREKCAKYWPVKTGPVVFTDLYEVHYQSENQPFPNLVVIEMAIKSPNEQR